MVAGVYERLKSLLSIQFINIKQSLSLTEIKKLINCFRKAVETKSHGSYKPLTPSENATLEEYDYALGYALENNDIKNIAVTGPNGAGKSTLIRTFERNWCRRFKPSFLHISLATFNFGKNETDKSSKDISDEIETSLLQQILYKPAANKLKDSDFRRLRTVVGIETSLGLVLFIASTLMLMKLEKLAVLFSVSTKSNLYSGAHIVLGSVSFLCLFYLIRYSPRLFRKLGINKLRAGGAELEIKADSILSKFTDELINFFKETKYQVVVFEDLDRFENKEIFTKLREINTLLNNSEEIKKRNKPIKFIYAIGDHIFEDSEHRIKFFDFILPVIPVVTSFNSYEKFRESIEENLIDHKLDNGLLKGTAWFINDMRSLLNISNEFSVYKRVLDGKLQCQDLNTQKTKINLNDTKLLSLIIFKNKCPKDFSELNYGQGYLASLFLGGKKELIETSSQILKIKKEKLKSELLVIENEKATNIEQLQAEYLFEIFSTPEIAALQIEGQARLLSEILSDGKLFEALREVGTIRYCKLSNTSSFLSLTKKFEDIEDDVDPNNSYNKRVETIEKKIKGRTEQIARAINDIDSEIKNVQKLKLKDLLEKTPELNIFDTNMSSHEILDKKEIEENLALIKFLVKNGYIDEDFASYLTYFYSGEISKNDREYIRGFLTKESSAFEFSLTNPRVVFREIEGYSFEDKAILNFEFLDYLLLEKFDSSKLSEFIAEACRNSNEFLSEYLLRSSRDNRKEIALLTNKLINLDNQYLINLLKSDSFFSQKILLDVLFNDLSTDLIKASNFENKLSEFLENYDETLDLLIDLEDSKVIDILSSLNIKFNNLAKCTNKKLLKNIENNTAFAINREVLGVLLRGKSKTSIKPSYSNIIKFLSMEAVDYINENINDFLTEILFKLEDINEDDGSVVQILNNPLLKNEFGKILIEKVSFQLTDIKSVMNKDFWDLIVECNKLRATWDNVTQYFIEKKNSLNMILIDYLNLEKNYELLSKAKIKTFSDQNESDQAKNKIISALCRSIIHEDGIDDIAYSKLLMSIPYSYRDLSDLEISVTKLNALLDSKKFVFNNKNYEFLVENLLEKSYKFIEGNFDGYIEDFQSYKLTALQFKQLLNSITLSKAQKEMLISKIPDNDAVGDAELAAAIVDVELKSVESIISEDLCEMIIGVLQDGVLQIKLFNKYSESFKADTVKALILKIKEISKLYSNQRPSIALNDENLRLASCLEAKGLVSFKSKGNQITLYPKKLAFN